MGERQRWAWLAAGASAVTGTSLCGLSWPWVLLGVGGAAALSLLWDSCLRPAGAAPMLSHTFGPLGRVWALVCALFSAAALAWCANLAVRAFPLAQGGPVLGWTLLALAAWGCRKGPGACAACAGVLTMFLLALYGAVAGFALPDLHWSYLIPTGSWRQALLALGLSLLPAGVFFLPCRRRRRERPWPWVLLLPLGAAALAAVTAGILSPELAAIPPTPLYLAAQSVSLFGVMEHIEPLLSVALTMGIFCLMAALTCAAQALADQVRPWKWSGPLACLAAAAAMGPAGHLPLEALALGAGVCFGVTPFFCLLRRRHGPKKSA